MEIFFGPWSNFIDTRDSALTVGSFDGIHLGHQKIFKRLLDSAKAQRLRSVVVTFEPHPRLVVPDQRQAIKLLTPTEEKIELLRKWPIDILCILRFDKTISELSHQEFVKIILKGRIGLKRIVIGYNHAFGKNRGGDRESLIALSRELDFQVEVLNPVEVGDTIVSSSKVRHQLNQGNVARAAELLGYRYALRGRVISGASRGKRLKFPTANLELSDKAKLIPADGVYCGIAHVEGQHYPAAISIGKNPTFADDKASIEAHLIGFDGHLYDQMLEIEFVRWLRESRAFPTETDLSKQIAEDVKQSLAILEDQAIFNRA